MAEVEARREARRRKILENAELRMKKITNLQNGTDAIECNLNSSTKRTSIENDVAQMPNVQVEENAEELELTSLFINRNFSVSSVETVTDKNTRAVVIVALAIFTRILQLVVGRFVDITERHLVNKIFSPFIAYEIVDVFIARSNVPSNTLLNFLLIFCNFSPNTSRGIMILLNTTTKIMQDLFVYFFSYAIAELLISSIY